MKTSNRCFQFGGVLTKLIPYFIAVVIYFTDFIPIESDIVGIVIKCLPIWCLIIFVGLHTINYEKEYKWFCYMVMFGLLFGSLGDALLYIGNFIEGAASFAVGHIFYITAYGWNPRAWIFGVICYALIIGLSIYIIPYLDGFLIVGLPLYGAIIVTMLWRASARIYLKKDWTITKWFVVFCAINFVVSDAFIGIDMFVTDIPNSHYIIMSTYYVAQLGMAISVLDPRIPEKHKDIA
ncbi:lysoplasmalogenase TMEM86A-like isoform X2 [Onthophagus taurus]|uniref:lysoplasmalogenase TMEM86A-like isoform X2 n=1 Tax=Onthophagus taurus TaxID=166361 RepID=UPI0039BE40E6